MKNAAILFIILGVVIAGIIVFFAFPRQAAAPVPQAPILFRQEAILRIGELEIPVEIADTSEEHRRGLSGRPSLPESTGMLFVFEEAGIYRFWMLNMHFPLDFIWIGSDQRVIGVTENAPPLFDVSNPVWYAPSAPAQYVLEVNAGFVRKHNIQIGDYVTLP
jgi:uncharacterized membrane protein (UPF0127 family)